MTGKKPAVRNWNSRPLGQQAIRNFIQKKEIAEANLGVRTGKLLAIDIDADDEDRAYRIEAMVRGALGATPFIRVGQWPRRTLFYRLRWPIGSKHYGEVDILSANKVCVVVGVHPSTGKPYRWPEECLLDHEFQDVPFVDERAVEYLTDWLTEETQNRKTLLAATMMKTAVQSAKAAGHTVVSTAAKGKVPAHIAEADKGERNDALFRELLRRASRLSADNIRARAIELNRGFRKPLPTHEVAGIAESVIKYKSEDRLFVRGEQKVLLPFGKDVIESFKSAPGALYLYAYLRANVSHKDTFTIPQKATAEVLGWGSNRVADAIDVLIRHGLISLIRTGGKTKTRRMLSQYRWCA
ncbi:bifunctional DNA primase/polymerase [Mesorhizobium koreense]|uniref:bifunctional DNA primase/polymerase n=1 Tax=Mesorhizobium koreense TaxID=3074855 RepID=UPI00287BAD9A|nr:bifunctional DNA primase/polymerase [Mesorhizobium sp. WR6]